MESILTQTIIRHRGPDLTKSGRLSLSKALLNNVSLNKRGRQVYHQYFLPFALLDDETNLSCLRQNPKMESRVRNSMYRLAEPDKDPAFFSFFSHHDVNRLSKMLNVEIVIYFTDSAKKFSTIEVFHDFRCLEKTRIMTGCSANQKCLYFVLTAQRELFLMPNNLDNFLEWHSPFFAKNNEHVKLRQDNSDCLKQLSLLLGLPEPPFELKNGISELIDKGSDVFPNDAVSELGSKLFSVWNEKLLIVTFCRNLNVPTVSRLNARKNPKNLYFVTLCVVAPSGIGSCLKELGLEDVKRVVCVYGNGEHACILSDDFTTSVLERHLKTVNRDRPLAQDFLKIPKVTRAETEAAKKKKTTDKKPTRADKKAGKKRCDCKVCLDTAFDVNMSKAGPEQLCSVPLDLRDLLKLLGIDSTENLQIVEQMCELSIASMDIEAMTVELNLDSPKPASFLNYGTIDSAQLEGHYKKVQKPIMISHVDALSVNDDNARITLTARGDSEDHFYTMMREYWSNVLKASYKCRVKKRQLAAPLFALIEKYKNAYFDAANAWIAWSEAVLAPEEKGNNLLKDYSPTTITRGWWQLLPGKLEKALNKLVSEYNIFTFYG